MLRWASRRQARGWTLALLCAAPALLAHIECRATVFRKLAASQENVLGPGAASSFPCARAAPSSPIDSYQFVLTCRWLGTRATLAEEYIGGPKVFWEMTESCFSAVESLLHDWEQKL